MEFCQEVFILGEANTVESPQRSGSWELKLRGQLRGDYVKAPGRVQVAYNGLMQREDAFSYNGVVVILEPSNVVRKGVQVQVFYVL